MERETDQELHDRQEQERADANRERQERLGHVPPRDDEPVEESQTEAPAEPETPAEPFAPAPAPAVEEVAQPQEEENDSPPETPAA
jgi:hypothetical protein